MTTRPATPAWSRVAQGWSREARDTLFLLAVIAWTVAPHVAHVPPWCSAMAAVALVWRAHVALAGKELPRRGLLLACLLAALAGTAWTFHTLLGKEAGLTLVVVLTALKTLELRARRDAFVVFFLGFFLILTQFLYSQSLPTALSMMLAVWGWLTALTLAHMPVGRPALWTAARRAGGAALMAVPTMVVLFVLFPRIGPLWGTPDSAGAGTGLSDTLRMGDIAQLALDDSVALRLRVLEGGGPGGRLPARTLYFRGPVLTYFDGRQWQAAPDHGRSAPPTPLALLGKHIVYEVTLEPNRLRAVPLIDATATVSMPPQGPAPSLYVDDLQWRSTSALTDRLRFTAQAWTAFAHGPTHWTDSLLDDVQLPPGGNPRSRAWAQALARSVPDARADASVLAQALLRHIRREPFRYTLAPGTYGADAIDEFWFDRRAGFCEHYATAFVFLMRAMGVPARVVTGFQGAQYNAQGGYYVVRNSQAHAWAEYWMPGRGWVRADPTAAVDPQRVDAGQVLPAPDGLMAGAFGRVAPAGVRAPRDLVDAVNNRWNQWVLNYSSTKQFHLLSDLGVQAPQWEDLLRALVIALCVVSAASVAWARWDARARDPWLHAYQRVQRACRRAGWTVPEHLPPLGLARLIAAHASASTQATASRLAQALVELDELRYGAHADGDTRRQLRECRRRLIALTKGLHYEG
jgi:transglutaminase-like putative cysteine protease